MSRSTMWILAVLLVCIATGPLFAQGTNLPSIASFEGTLPSYWTIGHAPAGATLSWATDQYRSMGHSLKIAKPAATVDSASWISKNMCDIWSPFVPPNTDVLLGAYVMTQGVNTNPVADSAKWWVSYSFWDRLGNFIGETKLPINQSVASSSGWVADTNTAGTTVLPDTAYTVIVKFVAGKNATGTVWADDFVFYGRTGWAGQDWNTSVGVPTGWYYWLPPNGGNDALLANGFENTVVTTEAAHTGTHSLKFSLPPGRTAHDGFVGTQRFYFSGGSDQFGGNGPSSVVPASAKYNPFNVNALPGDILELSVWIKASGLVPDSAAKNPGSWAVGFTPLFDNGLGNNYGYNASGPDYTFVFPPVTAFDWTQYKLDVTIPATVSSKPTQAMEVRLHVYSQFVGTVYFDDLNVKVIGTTAVNQSNNGLPKTFELAQNYPNPFNPSTTIEYGVPRSSTISLVIYNILGQRIRTLVDNEQRAAGRYSMVWDGRDDHGSTVGSGMYFFRLATGQVALVNKMLLLK